MLKKRYRLLIFDFDGTLVDTAPDIERAANKVLGDRGFPARGLDDVKTAIGKGVHELLRKLTAPRPLESGDLETATQEFKTYYRDHLLDHSRIYPGVVETLEGPLRGVKKAIVTNKPQDLTMRILEELRLTSFFERTIGTGAEFRAKPDPEAVRFVGDDLGIGADETILIGDSSVDCRTAQNAGIDFAWVKYGYEDVLEAAAQWTFRRPSEWAELVV